MLNKDGSFQRSFRFRGPDLESATEAELVATCARLNNVLRRLGSGWALFFEAERFEAAGYPNSQFPDAASWLVDEERRAAFQGEDSSFDVNAARTHRHFENAYTLTLLYMPAADRTAGAERAFLETGEPEQARDWPQELAAFVAETNRVLDLLAGIMPEVAALDDSETLTYLHGTVSTKRHRIAVPETPLYLDAILADEPLSGGLEPMLGDRHLRTLTILGFPNTTRPGILDALNHLDFPYRWMTRFIALDKTEATKTLTKLRRQWFNKRKSITAVPARSALQRARPASRFRRRQQGRRCRSRVAGAGRRSCLLRLSDHDHHRFRHRSARAWTKRFAPSSASFMARASPPSAKASMPWKPGWVHCPVTSTPMSANRWCIRSISPILCRCRRFGRGQSATSIWTDRRFSMPKPAARRRSAFPPMSAMSATC